MNELTKIYRKGKKRSKAAANAESSESKEILESNFEKEKKTEEEDEDKENLAAENLFGDPEVRGEDEDEDGKEEQQAVVSCSTSSCFKWQISRPRDVGALLRHVLLQMFVLGLGG